MSAPQKYRKLPVEIEAMRLESTDDISNLTEWMGRDVSIQWMGQGGFGIRIETLEGTTLARQGDWVIKGVQGEFYPCKPGIFNATYDIRGQFETQESSPLDQIADEAENLTHTEDTLAKVFLAMSISGLTTEQITAAINEMQNAGLLFRERS